MAGTGSWARAEAPMLVANQVAISIGPKRRERPAVFKDIAP